MTLTQKQKEQIFLLKMESNKTQSYDEIKLAFYRGCETVPTLFLPYFDITANIVYLYEELNRIQLDGSDNDFDVLKNIKAFFAKVFSSLRQTFGFNLFYYHLIGKQDYLIELLENPQQMKKRRKRSNQAFTYNLFSNLYDTLSFNQQDFFQPIVEQFNKLFKECALKPRVYDISTLFDDVLTSSESGLVELVLDTEEYASRSARERCKARESFKNIVPLFTKENPQQRSILRAPISYIEGNRFILALLDSWIMPRLNENGKNMYQQVKQNLNLPKPVTHSLNDHFAFVVHSNRVINDMRKLENQLKRRVNQ